MTSRGGFSDQFDPDDVPDGPEWLRHYYEDDYPDPTEGMTQEELEELLGQTGAGGLDPYTMEQIVEQCIKPVVTDGIAHIGKLLFWCIVFRFSTQAFRCPLWLCHLISVTTGIVALTHFFYSSVVYILILAFLSYVVLWIGQKTARGYVGPIVTASTITFNVACELFVATPQDWHKIRGAQMILSMKAISLAWDLDENNFLESKDRKDLLTSTPSLLEHLGYTLCPGNSVFGPWVRYSDYMEMLVKPVWNFTWLIKIVLTLVYGFMFLTISTCWNPWFIPDDVWIWWRAYRDAMSFRASHYFVSYVSEATATAAGLGANSRHKEGDWSKLQVAQPVEVEMPRSLRDVAKSWNKPMHLWLKDYCFKRVLPCGPVAAYLTTYLASVMLHGLNFQLGAVLLSLGFFAKVEHDLRARLADMFSASVGTARNDSCRHREWEIPVAAFNMVCGILVIFNLAYLGVMFNQDTSMAAGYSWRHTMSKWQELDFASHIVMAFLFVVGKLI